MKKSDFKEYLKTELRKMHEAEIEVDSAEKAAEVAKEIPDAKIKVSEFKNFLRQEILSEINKLDEQDEDSVELGDFDSEEEITTAIDPGESSKALALDDIGDQLVILAKKAKDVDERELANQILNSAKFAKKTEFKKVEKDAGVKDEEL